MNFEPLASRQRPVTLEEFVGQEHILGEESPLRKMIASGRWHSLLFWGPPGVGKTTLARIAAVACGSAMVELSAVSCGVKELREAIQESSDLIGQGKPRSILFVDEIHRLNKSQQDVLLPAIEKGIIGFIGATSENPSFEVNAAILSRTLTFRLDPLSARAMADLLSKAARGQNCTIERSAMELLIQMAQGDARRGLNVLEGCLSALNPKPQGQPPANVSGVKNQLSEAQANPQAKSRMSSTLAKTNADANDQPSAGLFSKKDFLKDSDDFPETVDDIHRMNTQESKTSALQPSLSFGLTSEESSIDDRRHQKECQQLDEKPQEPMPQEHPLRETQLKEKELREKELREKELREKEIKEKHFQVNGDSTTSDLEMTVFTTTDCGSFNQSNLSEAQASWAITEVSPANLAPDENKPALRHLTVELIKNLGLHIPLGHGEHYDLASAMIKSIRASHPDAGLYYMARLIEQGDDPMFIARRLVIFASEDVGNANPEALQIATAGASACQLVGFPEARIILSQVLTYLAASPKSNRSYLAIGEALECVKKTGKLPIPGHILNPVTTFNKQLGLGKGYEYPHNKESTYRSQSFMPPHLKGIRFYQPSEIGTEKLLKKNLEALRPTGDDKADD